MSNQITVTAYFDFKGKTYAPATVLMLDTFCTQASLPDLHALIATENNIDNYSYEYEMLIGTHLVFSQPQGDIANFMTADDGCDLAGYQQHWQQQHVLTQLAPQLTHALSLTGHAQTDALNTLLLTAYQMGVTR